MIVSVGNFAWIAPFVHQCRQNVKQLSLSSNQTESASKIDVFWMTIKSVQNNQRVSFSALNTITKRVARPSKLQHQ
jgi:hypothetical protein